jgi:hypothetical protein
LSTNLDDTFDLGARDYLEDFEKPLVDAIIETIDMGVIFIKNYSEDIKSSLML